MDIADGDDAIDALEFARRRTGAGLGRGRRQGKQSDDEQNVAARHGLGTVPILPRDAVVRDRRGHPYVAVFAAPSVIWIRCSSA